MPEGVLLFAHPILTSGLVLGLGFDSKRHASRRNEVMVTDNVYLVAFRAGGSKTENENVFLAALN